MRVIGRNLAPIVAQLGLLRASSEPVAGEHVVVDVRGVGNKPYLEDLMIATLAANVADFGSSMVGGVANSGTRWAMAAARRRGLNHCTILVEGPRTKGLCRQVEPDDIAGETVVLVDNWITTGGSLLHAEEIVADLGAVVVGAVVISAPTDLASVGDIPVRVLWPRDVLSTE